MLSENGTKKKIFVWGNNWIGDVIASLPALAALRTSYPGSLITILVSPPSYDILKNHFSVDKVMCLKKNESIANKAKMILYLRKKRFDIAIIFPNSFRSAFMTFLIGAKKIVGYNTDCRSLFLTNVVDPPAFKTTHIADYFFKIVESIGCDNEKKEAKIVIDSKDIIFAEDYIARHIPSEWKGQIVSIHPCTSKPPRAWNIEKFGELCSLLAKKYGLKFVILGTSAEYSQIIKLQDYIKDDIIIACKGINLSQAAGLIKKSCLFIGNDSGMMHLAAALEVPTIGIFGPDIPERTKPVCDDRFFVPVTKGFTCSPCKQHFFKDCKPSKHNKAPCIEAIEVGDVLQGIDEINVHLGLFGNF